MRSLKRKKGNKFTKIFPKIVSNIKFIERQEIWMLTFQGWLIAFFVSICILFFIFTNLYSFLAVTSPIKTDVMVIEGWITDGALKQAVAEIERGNYSQIFTTGIPVEIGHYLAKYKTFADICTASLREMGVPESKIISVPTPGVIKDRTEAGAVAFQKWLEHENYQVKSVNLFTANAHARRSWLIFKRVLEPHMKVGIIASVPENYTPQTWWKTSEGVRVVLSESIAYLYALFSG